MRERRHREISNENQSRDRWLLSYADLVTLLLGLFIVLYASSDGKRAQLIAQSFSAQQGGSGVLDGTISLAREPDQAKVLLSANPAVVQMTRMKRTAEGLVVSLSEAGFFAPGEAAINPESDSALQAIAEAIKSNTAAVRIEGHTDSTTISTAKFPSNWELSTARAANVLARLIERGVEPQRLSAAGFAGFRPVEDNSTPEGRAQNRRVDIVILDH